MEDTRESILAYREAVRIIKEVILQSRYRSATNANAEMLGLYYGVGRYISANTRTGKWGMGAIESISAQLQGGLPGLRGFSPSNMKSMRIFYEQWASEFEINRQNPPVNMGDYGKPALNRQTLSADLFALAERLPIRQTATDDLEYVKMAAFTKVGFSHHI